MARRPTRAPAVADSARIHRTSRPPTGHGPVATTRRDSPSPTKPGQRGPAAAPSSWTRVTALRATLGYALLALAYLAVAFKPDRQLGGSDYTAAGYMVMEFVTRAIHAGHLPRWLPDIMGGVPLFANPGSTFQPVRLLLAGALPVADVLAALFAVYFVVAGAGMYALLRELRCRPWVAALGGLAYEFTGMLASLLYAGHDGRFIVTASAPLFLACLHRGVRSGRVGPFVGVAVTLGGALLSFQLQSAYYLLLAGAAWSLFTLASARPRDGAPGAPSLAAWFGRRVALGLAAVAVAFALAAVNFVPFVDYIAASPRAASAGRGYSYATAFSTPLVETLGLAVPEDAGVLGDYAGASAFKLHTEYVGALVVVLAAVGLLVCVRDRRWWFFAALGAFGATLAWGGYTPLYRLYYAVLPGTAKFRAPSIAMYVATLALVVMTGLTLERLAVLREAATADWAVTRRRIRTLLGAIVGITLLTWATQSVGGPLSAPAAHGWLRFGLCTAVIAGTLVAWLDRRLPTRLAATMLALATLVDLWVVDRRFLLVVERPETLYAPDDVVTYLAARPDRGRVWVYDRPVPGDSGGYLGNEHFGAHSNYLMHFGIAQIGGEHGNQLQRWNEYGGVGSGDLLVDWHNLVRWPAMRRAAGIRYAVARVDLTRMRTAGGEVVPSGMESVHGGRAQIYRDDGALPRTYLVPAVVVAPVRGGALAIMAREDWDPRRSAVAETPIPGVPARSEPSAGTPSATPPLGTTAVLVDMPDSVVVRAAAPQPALLVLADNYYPDWTVTVDGAPASMYRVNHTFRGVVVGPGTHDVVFAFRPASLYRGLWISIATGAVLLLWAVMRATGTVARRRLRSPAFVEGLAA